MAAKANIVNDTRVVVRLEYRRHGRRRAVLIGRDRTGVWSVYDLAAQATRAWVVQRLAGYEDKAAQASAIAADYVACQLAYLTGKREHCTCPDPLPHPKKVRSALAREDALRAEQVLAAHAERTRATQPTPTPSRRVAA